MVVAFVSNPIQPARLIELLPVGTRVTVRDRFCASWACGFEIATATRHGYELRRTSDCWVLPVVFPTDEVKPAEAP
jgi:hypothetical protein